MARGMKVLTVFLPVEEFAAVMESAAQAGQKPYAWARAALRTATRSQTPRSAPGRPSIEQVVTERMDANTFFARMAAAGYDDEQAEESSQARTAALRRGTIRDGRENGSYFIEPTGVKP